MFETFCKIKYDMQQTKKKQKTVPHAMEIFSQILENAFGSDHNL